MIACGVTVYLVCSRRSTQLLMGRTARRIRARRSAGNLARMNEIALCVVFFPLNFANYRYISAEKTFNMPVCNVTIDLNPSLEKEKCGSVDKRAIN